MKSLILSPNQVISTINENARTHDVLGLYDYLESCGLNPHFGTHLSNKYHRLGFRHVNELEIDFNEWDNIYIYNDIDSFFGGILKKQTLQQAKKISTYNGSLHFVFTDPALNKDIYKRLFQRGYISQDEYISIRDKDWTVIWPGVDMNINFFGKIKLIQHLDILSYANRYISYNNDILNFQSREFDLVYYGDLRRSRIKTFDRFFNSGDIKKLFIGLKSTYPNSEFTPKIKRDQLRSITNRAISTLTIGDPKHNNNIVTSRFYENSVYGCINFIDVEYDTKRRLYRNDLLREFCYVTNHEDIHNRLKNIDENIFYTILDLQKKEIYNNYGN